MEVGVSSNIQVVKMILNNKITGNVKCYVMLCYVRYTLSDHSMDMKIKVELYNKINWIIKIYFGKQMLPHWKQLWNI